MTKRIEVQLTPENIDRIRALCPRVRMPVAVEAPELGAGLWIVVSVSAVELRPVYGQIALEYWVTFEVLRPAPPPPVHRIGPE